MLGAFTRLTLYHRKSNFSALEKEPRLLQYTIGKDRGPVRLAYRLPFKESTRLTDRIKAAVGLGPMTREELRQRLGTADPETVKRTIRRGLETGWLTERKGRLALAAAKAA